MVEFCCEDMKNNVYCTDQDWVSDDGDKEDKIIYYVSRFDEYGVPMRDGGEGLCSSYIGIDFCPWCGRKLPESKRDDWFETLEKLGYDEPMGQEIPKEFESSEWYDK